ncbi:hypothetical protein [Shinella zoogloeoides]|uniref:hypothetical protein n=1 Tax=Shinella zoogloeoides TaxID=352475 RepID=UPI00273E3896|nr:hypothetical protein [Shinella zoogloeoides]WLR94630.1 hypothetical protein Q9316_10830 [Shinella zoogloeoides]
MAMGIFGKVLEFVKRYCQSRAEREALRLLIARGDERLLRDVGLRLVEMENETLRCEPLPQTKERRWTAPLIRLSPPSPRKRGEGDAAPLSSSTRPNGNEKALGLFPSPRLRGEGGRQAG